MKCIYTHSFFAFLFFVIPSLIGMDFQETLQTLRVQRESLLQKLRKNHSLLRQIKDPNFYETWQYYNPTSTKQDYENEIKWTKQSTKNDIVSLNESIRRVNQEINDLEKVREKKEPRPIRKKQTRI